MGVLPPSIRHHTAQCFSVPHSAKDEIHLKVVLIRNFVRPMSPCAGFKAEVGVILGMLLHPRVIDRLIGADALEAVADQQARAQLLGFRGGVSPYAVVKVRERRLHNAIQHHLLRQRFAGLPEGQVARQGLKEDDAAAPQVRLRGIALVVDLRRRVQGGALRHRQPRAHRGDLLPAAEVDGLEYALPVAQRLEEKVGGLDVGVADALSVADGYNLQYVVQQGRHLWLAQSPARA
mmetsp:Transcript_5649/g.14416  ORF Transcript_5649/g.14416 Transcript_5649/m.14416 type:complete len:234 (+) Transcript_5649:59-760(+)